MNQKPDADRGHAVTQRDLWHVVITRHTFPYPGRYPGGEDRLNPKRLEFRLKIFELSCLPSVLAQTNQQFDWIIILDENHPAEYRERLLRCINNRPRTFLHVVSVGADLSSFQWLSEYVPRNTKHVITTNLDDDDSLPVNFIETVQSLVTKSFGGLPPLMTFGYKSSVQWELISTRRAPLGYNCAWHRPNWVRSAGFSLLSHPEHNVTCYALDHMLTDVWFESEKGDKLRSILLRKWGEGVPPEIADDTETRIGSIRARLESSIESAIQWRNRTGGELFVELSGSTGPIVMTNHFSNAIAFRLLEHKADRVPVTGRETFPNTVLRLDGLKGSKSFKKRWRELIKLIGRTRDEDAPLGIRLHGRLQRAIWASRRFVAL